MTRSLTTIIGTLVLSATLTAAEEPKTVTLRWQGQSFFEIQSSQGTRIVTDPHEIPAFGRKDVSADIVLISHFHNDHTQVEVLKNQGKFRVVEGLKRNGKKIDWNPVDEKIRDVHIRTVGVYHDGMAGMERGKNAIFAIEVDGLRFVHLGDLGHVLSEQTIKQIGPVDVLMIPVGGVYTINGAEAKQVVAQLKPRQYIIPMHYGTKGFDDLLPPDEFLEDQKNVKKFLGNKLTISTDFKPAEPIVALLEWKN